MIENIEKESSFFGKVSLMFADDYQHAVTFLHPFCVLLLDSLAKAQAYLVVRCNILLNRIALRIYFYSSNFICRIVYDSYCSSVKKKEFFFPHNLESFHQRILSKKYQQIDKKAYQIHLRYILFRNFRVSVLQALICLAQQLGSASMNECNEQYLGKGDEDDVAA